MKINKSLFALFALTSITSTIAVPINQDFKVSLANNNDEVKRFTDPISQLSKVTSSP
ncbi:5735_t:CDS:1, partial [Ambispora gerdemannii]